MAGANLNEVHEDMLQRIDRFELEFNELEKQLLRHYILSDKPQKKKEKDIRELFARIQARMEDDEYECGKISKLADLFGMHRFWNNQPVMNYLDCVPQSLFQQPVKHTHVSQVPVDMLPIPPEYSWSTVDLDNGKVMREVYQLLADNYVEDQSGSFRFEY